MKKELAKESIETTFNHIASTYDRINRILSFGIDRLWRKSLCKKLPKDQPLNILDIATGTGDQAFEILKQRPLASVTGIDKAEKMLELAKEKIQNTLQGSLHFLVADAAHLPFDDTMFDCITISFGIRNFADLAVSIQEMLRVLKKRGMLLILEFGHPKNSLVRFFYLFYLRTLLPKIGGFFSKHPKAYKYLNESIEDFPSGKDLCFLLEKHGFSKVTYHPLSFGIVNLYIGRKHYD